MALYTSTEHYDIQSMNGSNITCNITFHGECFSCPSLSISKYCAWQRKSASYIINPPTKSSSTSDQGHHVVVLYSPFISFYPRVNPTIRFSHVLLQEHLPCSSMQAKLPKESLRGVCHKEWETTRNTVPLSRNASDFISHTSLALTSWLHLPIGTE